MQSRHKMRVSRVVAAAVGVRTQSDSGFEVDCEGNEIGGAQSGRCTADVGRGEVVGGARRAERERRTKDGEM